MVSFGTLLITSVTGSGTGSGPVSISRVGTFASGAGTTGAIAGLVTTAATGSTIAPGATASSNVGTVGTLTLSGGLNLAAGATILFDLGSTSDLIRISSGIFTGGTNANSVTFNFNNLGVTPGTYALINFSGATASSVDLSDFNATGVTGTFQFNGSELDFITTVPEPGTIAAGLLALGTLGWSQRRRVRNCLDARRRRFALPVAA